MKLLYALIFSFLSFAALPAQVLSQQNSNSDGLGNDGGGADTIQTSTGTRSGCGLESDSTESTPRPSETITLTAIVPPEKIYGGTTRESPTFWFHIHYTAEAPQSEILAEFKMDNQDETRFLAPITVQLPKTSGFVSITLPATEKLLEVDKWYNWSFSIICDRENRDYDIIIPGWVQRVNIDSSLPTPSNQIGKDLMWYDTVDRLSKNRCENINPASSYNEWEQLLRENQLEKLIDQPRIECFSQ